MIKSLTYKQKFYLLIAGFFVMLLIIYLVAVKGTLEMRKECRILKKKVVQVENAPQRIARLELELSEINSVLSSDRKSEEDKQELLLDVISRYCQENNLVLKEFPEAHKVIKNKYALNTWLVTVEGGFIKLLKLLYTLETNRSYGTISSADFHSYSDKRNKKYRLNLTICIQNIHPIDN